MNSSASLRYMSGSPSSLCLTCTIPNLPEYHSVPFSLCSRHISVFPPYFSPNHTRTHAFLGISAFFFSFFFSKQSRGIVVAKRIEKKKNNQFLLIDARRWRGKRDNRKKERETKESGKGALTSCMTEAFCVGSNAAICAGESCKTWRSICCWSGGRVESAACAAGGRDANPVAGGAGPPGGPTGTA